LRRGFSFFLHNYKIKMEKEINFKIEVRDEKEFEKVHEILRVKMANMELAGALKIVDLGVKAQKEELVKEK